MYISDVVCQNKSALCNTEREVLFRFGGSSPRPGTSQPGLLYNTKTFKIKLYISLCLCVLVHVCMCITYENI